MLGAKGLSGINFLRALAMPSTEETGSAGRNKLAVGVVVLRLAEVALAGGHLDDTWLEANAQLRRLTCLSTYRRLRDILAAMSESARRVAGWEQQLGVHLMAYGHELYARGEYASAADVFKVVSESLPDEPELRRQAKQQGARARAAAMPRPRRPRSKPAAGRTRPMYYASNGELKFFPTTYDEIRALFRKREPRR